MFWWPLSLYFLKPACRITLPANTAYACCLGCVQVRIISQRKSVPKNNRLLQTSWWRERSLAKTNTWSSIALPLPPSLNPTIPASIIIFTRVSLQHPLLAHSHTSASLSPHSQSSTPPLTLVSPPLSVTVCSHQNCCANSPACSCEFARAKNIVLKNIGGGRVLFWTPTFLSANSFSTTAEITTTTSVYLLWKYQRRLRTQHCRLRFIIHPEARTAFGLIL